MDNWGCAGPSMAGGSMGKLTQLVYQKLMHMLPFVCEGGRGSKRGNGIIVRCLVGFTDVLSTPVHVQQELRS